MRTLEECRQEIFLRSRQRIRRRKIITGVIAGCIPVVLTAVLLLAPTPKSSDKATLSGAVPEQYAESAQTSGDSSRLPAVLEGYFHKSESAPDGAPPTEPPADPPTFAGGENYASPAPIRITCTTAEGDPVTYVLEGDTLTNEATGASVTLSPEQRAQLEALWLQSRKE